jgi:phage/plasmid-like protein (TIGR03299 family)
MTPRIDVAERMKIIGARFASGKDTWAGRTDAWHSMGNVTGKYMTWKEALNAGGGNYEVVKKQLEWKGKLVDAWGTFRLDATVPKGLEDRAIRVMHGGEEMYLTFLSPIGADYLVIDHREGFQLLDSIVGQIDGAHYDTMGTLDFGAFVWGQINLAKTISVGDDKTELYATFHTSHDASKAFQAFLTAVREVCRNTVRAGELNKLSRALRVKHTKNALNRIGDMKAQLAEISDLAMTFEAKLNFLAKRKMTRESLVGIMDRLFPKAKDENGEAKESTRRENIVADILTLYEHNDGNVFPEQRGTAYNLLNAITEYTDHARSTKGDGRAVSAVLGSGDKLKSSALDLILGEAKAMPGIERSIQVDYADLGLNIRSN